MVNITININPLTTQLPPNHKGEKLVIINDTKFNGRKITWEFSENLDALKESGTKFDSSLRSITNALKNIDFTGLNKQEIKTIRKNVRWVKEKNEKHNSKIEKKIFLKILDKMIWVFTFGIGGLKRETLEILDQQLTNERKFQKQLSNGDLSHLSDNDLHSKLNVSYPEKLQILNYNDFSKEQKELYLKLLKIKHTQTVRHLIENPGFAQAFYEDSKTNPAVRAEPAFAAWFATYEQMMSVPYIPENLKYDLFRTAMFIEENRSKMAAGTIGSTSRTRSHILKVKKISKKGGFNIPLELEYNKKDGDIVVCLGQIGKGSFKVVKNHLSLYKRQMEVIGKQSIPVDDPAEDLPRAKKEIKILESVKGVSNLAQLNDSSIYVSPKKQKTVVLTKAPYYNMGTLKSCIEKQSLTPEMKGKIAVDIIVGVLKLHQRGIVHRDLKPENIYLTKEKDKDGKEYIKAVIADPGLACWTSNDPDLNESFGSPLFMSPQSYLYWEKGRVEDDYWALGHILSELFTGTFLTKSAYDKSDLTRILKGLETKNPSPSDPNSMAHIAWRLTQFDPKDRINLTQTLRMIECL